MFKKNRKEEKAMFEKGKTYTYEEIKENFEKVETEVIINPFGDEQENSEKKLSRQSQFMVMLTAVPVINTLKTKLFGKEK